MIAMVCMYLHALEGATDSMESSWPTISFAMYIPWNNVSVSTLSSTFSCWRPCSSMFAMFGSEKD